MNIRNLKPGTAMKLSSLRPGTIIRLETSMHKHGKAIILDPKEFPWGCPKLCQWVRFDDGDECPASIDRKYEIPKEVAK